MSDMLMARGLEEPGWINLAIGEPYFLSDHFPTTFTSIDAYLYQPAHGEESLVKQLEEIYPGHHAVVTNGAKQALHAAIYALGHSRVHSTAPYWPSFPHIASEQAAAFSSLVNPTTGCGRAGVTRILTLPNNPDGYDLNAPPKVCDIWDAVYAHKVYGYRPEHEPFWRIKIESASKRFGVSGYRVGWLVTENKWLAQRAAEYMELTTSGVSAPVQREVAALLRADDRYFAYRYDRARATLVQNGQTFLRELRMFVQTDHILGLPNNGTGMFAWFQVDEPGSFAEVLKEAKVRLLPGEAFGATEPGWWRMSLGHRSEVVEDACKRIRQALRG